MNATSSPMPGVRVFASTLRVKLCRERSVAAPSPSSARCVCPASGQLRQCWRDDDSQDPLSRRITQQRQPARKFDYLRVGTCTFH
nr:hypothetical protein [uncultured Pseudomonas sp.]